MYATKAYTVYHPAEKEIIIPNVLEMVSHIKHFLADIRVGDRVTVDAGYRHQHMSGERIIAGIALITATGKSHPRIDAVLYDPTKPPALHSAPMSVVKSVIGKATVNDTPH
jgi:hypothetical protein